MSELAQQQGLAQLRPEVEESDSSEVEDELEIKPAFDEAALLVSEKPLREDTDSAAAQILADEPCELEASAKQGDDSEVADTETVDALSEAEMTVDSSDREQGEERTLSGSDGVAEDPIEQSADKQHQPDAAEWSAGGEAFGGLEEPVFSESPDNQIVDEDASDELPVVAQKDREPDSEKAERTHSIDSEAMEQELDSAVAEEEPLSGVKETEEGQVADESEVIGESEPTGRSEEALLSMPEEASETSGAEVATEMPMPEPEAEQAEIDAVVERSFAEKEISPADENQESTEEVVEAVNASMASDDPLETPPDTDEQVRETPVWEESEPDRDFVSGDVNLVEEDLAAQASAEDGGLEAASEPEAPKTPEETIESSESPLLDDPASLENLEVDVEAESLVDQFGDIVDIQKLPKSKPSRVLSKASQLEKEGKLQRDKPEPKVPKPTHEPEKAKSHGFTEAEVELVEPADKPKPVKKKKKRVSLLDSYFKGL
ncbi:hypothetical protein [Pelagicoccus sp. SDUM812003]|uniref:hypothetical protein n=1 Tax=Pelagicoccus sp. SDUM812003 TaxID=3041267 RepID=UPI00281275B8|nr:hypothetical protein [Pelagicoccus sp. SDUM812003]